MNKEELKKYIKENYSNLDERLVNNILDYAEGMEEIEQYNYLCAILPIPEIIIRKVNY